MISHSSPISGIATSGGQYVATAGYDNQVILWDASSGKGIARALHDHLANQCIFSPNGKFLASSSSDYSARIWSVPDMRLRTILTDHEDDVEAVAFHQIREWIATGSRDNDVRVFDLHGNLLMRMKGHKADVISIAWLNDSDQLVTSSDDGTIKRWDAQTGHLIDDIDLHGAETDALTVSTTGTIFAGNDEGCIIVVEERGSSVYKAHDAGIKRLIYDHQTGLLLSMSYDRSAKFWTFSHDQGLILQHQTHLPSIVWPRSGAFLSPNEVVFVTFGSTYATYSLSSDQWLLEQIRETNGVNSACLYRDSVYSVRDSGAVYCNSNLLANMGSLCNFIAPFADRLLTGGQMGILYDAQTGEHIYQHKSPLNCIATFRHRGMPVAIIGTYTGEGLVFCLDNGRAKYLTTICLHQNAIKCIAESAGRLFSVCATGAAAWHDAQTFLPVLLLKNAHDKIANACVGLPNGCFASISRDRKIRLWSPDGKSEVIHSPHQNSIKCCIVSKDGDVLITGDYAGRVFAFNIAAKRFTQPVRPTSSGISSLTLGLGDSEFLATSYDGRIYTLAIHEGKLLEVEPNRDE